LPEPLRVDTTNVDSIGIYELYYNGWTDAERVDRRQRKFSPERSEAPVLARHFNYVLMTEFLEREIVDDEHVLLAFHGWTDLAQVVIPYRSTVEITREGRTWVGEPFCIRYTYDGKHVLPSIEFASQPSGLALVPVRSTEFDLIAGKIVPPGTLYGLGEVMGTVPFWVRLQKKGEGVAKWKRVERTPVQFRLVPGKEVGSS